MTTGLMRDILLITVRMASEQECMLIGPIVCYTFGSKNKTDHLNRDTTWNTSLGFVKAMLLHPEVAKAAQKEIDEVIGPDRMPSWEDRARLPYIRGVLAETLRCKQFHTGHRYC